MPSLLVIASQRRHDRRALQAMPFDLVRCRSSIGHFFPPRKERQDNSGARGRGNPLRCVRLCTIEPTVILFARLVSRPRIEIYLNYMSFATQVYRYSLIGKFSVTMWLSANIMIRFTSNSTLNDFENVVEQVKYRGNTMCTGIASPRTTFPSAIWMF